jgi:EAL domain-containing protein (putative c-di-GMP-specific phosphodiesterase class I)
MQEVVNKRAFLENELRKAIEQQQFQLYYQVQKSDNQGVTGAEALIRWIHPDRGMISPLEFIPLAEKTGQILNIGLWVLETACAQIQSWQQHSATKQLTISINISAKQLLHTQFVTQVKTALSTYSIPPSLLKLELTESILLDDIDNIIDKMYELAAMGIGFSLDDFGTGYSSLQYLKKLPLSQLKIDKSFVRDIATNTNDQALVCAIIAMAKSLDINVIAEGIETEEQYQYLKNNGCLHYQGYLFGKPMPIEMLDALIQV